MRPELLLLLVSLARAASSLDDLLERCIRDGIRDIRRSMSRIISDPEGISVENEVRLQTRDMFIDLLQAVRGVNHYEIYLSFTNALDEERLDYYRSGFASIFYTFPLFDSMDAVGPVSQAALEVYRLAVWSASMEREDDVMMSRIVKLVNEFIREMTKHKWRRDSAESKFIAVTKKRLEKLQRTLARYYDSES